ncbi:hypothetical protein MFLAVUS_002136 [Mucor flavus]|uniref:Uncharacterized protein n=1 Tax=Mucor flavus TaxID=439312 RepID=A0ABP9YPG4_9FUNG
MGELQRAQTWLENIYVTTLNRVADVTSNIKQDDAICITAAATFTSILAYMGIVRYNRYKNLNLIRAKYPNPDDILNDSEAAHFVYNIVTRKEFPYLSRIALELAFFKTFTVPTISKILASTGEFSDENVARRAEDTDLVLGEIVETYGRIQKQLQSNPNTPKKDIEAQYQRPIDSVHRLNELHGKYPILNDDFIYTLTLFVFEPVSWINRYEWRQLDVREENAFFKVWYDIGKSMNIVGVPESKEELLKFKEIYLNVF